MSSLSRLTLRVKRQKSTYFVECDSTDTIQTVKTKLLSLIVHTSSGSAEPNGVNNKSVVVRDARDIKLLVPKDKISTTVDYKKLNDAPTLELEDKAILDQVGVCDDAVLFAVFWISNDANAADGKWEAISIPEPDSLDINIDPESMPLSGLPDSLVAGSDVAGSPYKVDKGKGKLKE